MAVHPGRGGPPPSRRRWTAINRAIKAISRVEKAIGRVSRHSGLPEDAQVRDPDPRYDDDRPGLAALHVVDDAPAADEDADAGQPDDTVPAARVAR